MNKELKQAAESLSRITPERASCLDAVTRCQPLISWLRDTIKGNVSLCVLTKVHIHLEPSLHILCLEVSSSQMLLLK